MLEPLPPKELVNGLIEDVLLLSACLVRVFAQAVLQALGHPKRYRGPRAILIFVWIVRLYGQALVLVTMNARLLAR